MSVWFQFRAWLVPSLAVFCRHRQQHVFPHSVKGYLSPIPRFVVPLSKLNLAGAFHVSGRFFDYKAAHIIIQWRADHEPYSFYYSSPLYSIWAVTHRCPRRQMKGLGEGISCTAQQHLGASHTPVLPVGHWHLLWAPKVFWWMERHYGSWLASRFPAPMAVFTQWKLLSLSLSTLSQVSTLSPSGLSGQFFRVKIRFTSSVLLDDISWAAVAQPAKPDFSLH